MENPESRGQRFLSPGLGASGGSGLEMKDLYLEFCLCPMISEDSNGGSIRIIPKLLSGKDFVIMNHKILKRTPFCQTPLVLFIPNHTDAW